MAEKNQDLGITQKQDGDYWDIVVPGLDASTDYAAQFAWVYADKTKGTSEFSDFFEFRTPAPRRTCPINVSASWDDKANLNISFEKPFLADNVTRDNRIRSFQLEISAPGKGSIFATVVPKENVNVYSWQLSQPDNMFNFNNEFQTTLTGKITSIYGDGSSNDCVFTIPVYVDPICANLPITPKATSTIDGIVVVWQDPATSYGTYRETKVYYSETNNPYDWELVYTGFGPAVFKVDTLETIYIKINHLSDSNCESLDSAIITAKALDLVNFKDYAPDEFTDISSEWISNSNSLNDLKITFKLPQPNPAKKDNIGKMARIFFKVLKDGEETEEFIDKQFTEPYTHGATKNVTIFASELYGRFGSYNPSFIAAYSNKKGKISAVDRYDNASPGAPFDIGVRVNPLATYTPTISVVGVANGYEVSNTNTNSVINRYEVYSSKSSGGPFELVYAGILPAFILDIDYTLTYVKVKAITLAGDSSLESAVATVTPLSVAETSLIEFPVAIGTEGSIWSGPLQDSEAPFGEPDRDENGRPIPIQAGARAFFNRRGFFIYDNAGDLTTQIIGDGTIYNNPYIGSSGGTISNSLNKLTFITKSAQIANWRVSTDRIENTLDTPDGDTYTGMSGSGLFAFWAGGNSSGNLNSQAQFQVTHSGKVTASNIDILGGKLRVGGNTDLLAPFLVTSSGTLTATQANIKGTVIAKEGQLGSVDIGTPPLHPDYGTVNQIDGQLRINAPITINGVTTYSKIEMGVLSNTSLADFDLPQAQILAMNSGIQITNSSNKIVQLDSYNGILVNKGWVGGWEITKDTITKAGNVGMYAPKNPQSTDIAFWAGTSRTGNPGPNFKVYYSGDLYASNATIKGTIEAREGYIGLYDSATQTITQGWKINGKFLESFGGANPSVVKVKLDGLQGTIAGGNLVGSNVFFWNPTNWFQENSGEQAPDPNTWNPETGAGSGNPGNIDYISSSGNFRLANGNLTYDGNSFKVRTDLVASNVFLGTAESFSNDYLLGKSTTIDNTTKAAGSFSLGDGAITYDANADIFEVNSTGKSYANFKVRLNATSDENNSFADSTIVQNGDGYMTVGRAFQYGGNQYPIEAGAEAAKVALRSGQKPFVKGDIWFSTKA